MNYQPAFLLIILLLFGCVSDSSVQTAGQNNSTVPPSENSSLENVRVEVYHFHGTHQCYSCIRVGELAEKTVNTHFKEELESGKLVFSHINGELPENRGLVDQYGVSSASLWIGTYVDGEFHKEQNINVWYKIDNEAEYLAYLKGVLDQRLAGRLN